jgi:competence protein ComEA
MSWKKFVNDYFTFSKNDRIGIICVLVLIIAVYFLPHLFAKQQANVAIEKDTALAAALDTLQQRENKNFDGEENFTTQYPFEQNSNKGFTEGELFTFDPNTLSTEGWQRLGLNDRTIKTINNYRSKGGHFYKSEDLKKIWGLPPAFYERVKGNIEIAVADKTQHFENPFTERPKYEKPERRIAVVNVNTADTSALIALPGIGSKLATRIIAFRDKLGGFYSVDQIGETYGLPDSTYQKLKPYLNVSNNGTRKININSATKDELKIHPYIRWNIANAIVEYRNQHGPFKNLNDLKNIMLIDEKAFEKIAPYVTF